MNNPYPNAYPQQMQQDPAILRAKDESDLNTLSILHYVWSALLGLMTVVMVIYFVAIAGFVATQPTAHGADPHAQAVGASVVAGMGVFMGLLFVPLFVLHLLAAGGLRKRKRYMLSMIMSGMACLSVPLGTALGIWSIVVLNRPGVKALYGRV